MKALPFIKLATRSGNMGPFNPRTIPARPSSLKSIIISLSLLFHDTSLYHLLTSSLLHQTRFVLSEPSPFPGGAWCCEESKFDSDMEGHLCYASVDPQELLLAQACGVHIYRIWTISTIWCKQYQTGCHFEQVIVLIRAMWYQFWELIFTFTRARCQPRSGLPRHLHHAGTIVCQI